MKLALIVGSMMCVLLFGAIGQAAPSLPPAHPILPPQQFGAIVAPPAGPVVLAGWLFGKQHCKVGNSCCAHWWDVQCW